MTYTVEDILEKALTIVNLSSSDKTILFSIFRQVKKNVGLTDRQYALVKEKLSLYKDDLVSAGITTFDECLVNLKLPLRSVDRTKIVTVVNGKEINVADSHQWIKIKFPFNKKTITLISDLAKKYKKYYHHESGSSSHYFRLNEVIVEEVVDRFVEKNFDIDAQLIDLNSKVKDIKMKKEHYLPGLYNNNLLNFRPAALELINKEVGDVTDENKIKLYDRRKRYGIAHIQCEKPAGLIGEIAFRETTAIGLNPETVSVKDIAETLVSLDRFPLLVIVDTDFALTQVTTVYEEFSKFVENKNQSVLFRVDNSTEYNVNNFIKDNQLNNWVDNNTKIVYISKDKLPKVLMRSNWQPLSTLTFSAERFNSYVSLYASSFSDLNICVSNDYEKFGRKFNNEILL